MTEKVSSVIEEYLENIYRLQEKDGVARTSELVKLLKVSPGTITNTVERLEREDLVVHRAYKGVILTEKGRIIALRIVRKHRLSERLLTDILKVRWDKAHEAACQLEHGISEEIAKKIEKTLGHPKTCPHGNPIPTECGGIIEEESEPLTNLNIEETGIILKITDERPEILRYLGSIEVRPGTSVKVVEKAPFNGPVTIRIKGNTHALDRKITSALMVRKIIGTA